jgi:hypothetical protein
VSIEKELNPTFSVSFGVRNTNYGLKLTSQLTDFDGHPTGETVVTKFNYWTIQTPLQVIIKPFKSKNLSFNFGGYWGYNYYNSTTSPFPLLPTDPNQNKNTIDKGLLVGIDYTCLKRGNFNLGNSISYYRGFNNIAPNSTYVTRRSQGLTVGFIGTLGF